MMQSSCHCNKKSKFSGNKEYVCNLKTGRWIKINGPTYNQLPKEMMKTANEMGGEKYCKCSDHSQFSQNKNYQCNLQTGRWIKIDGQTSKKNKPNDSIEMLQTKKNNENSQKFNENSQKFNETDKINVETVKKITIRPKKSIEQTVQVLTGVELYLKFLSNTVKTGSGKLYSQILKYDAVEMEMDHQFIQWIFPLDEPSMYAPSAPVIDIMELSIATKNLPYIIPKLQLSYHLIMKHWGFNVNYVEKDNANTVINLFHNSSKPYMELQKARNFKKKIELLNGHNGLRLSRVLQSLVYHGQKKLAIYTYTKIMENISYLHPSVNDDGVTLWKFFLDQSIKKYSDILLKLHHNPSEYLEKVIGDIGEIGELFGKNKMYPEGPIAVVNAANSMLSTGAGVTGALVKSVGGAKSWNSLTSAARTFDGQTAQLPIKINTPVYTPTSGQLITDGVKYIIHGLGPVAGIDDISLIKITIFSVLKLADELGVKTLILPAISGGIFAMSDPQWPVRIRKIIVNEIINYMNNQPAQISKIYLISYDDKDQKLWPPIK
jgi:O-acetyl-ADP-ribose deacetylase (regulator of RNase III)